MTASAHLLLVALSALLTYAQNAPSCPSSLSWLDNTKNQDPCHVQAWLYAQCYGDSNFTLWELGTTYSGYPGPTSMNQTEWIPNGCLCSMPIYNLAMACQSACQGHNAILWSQWTASCNSSFTGRTDTPTLQFPQPVPSGTEIPPWAMIDNRNQQWTQQEAQANVTAGQTSSSTSTSSTGTPTQSSGGGGGGGGSKTNAGAIAGGVVGGIAVIAALGLGWLYLSRRKASNRRPVSEGSQPESGFLQGVQVTPYATSGSPAYSNPTHTSGQWSSSQSGQNPFSSTPSPRPNDSSQGHSTTYVPVPEVMNPSDLAREEPDSYPVFQGTQR